MGSKINKIQAMVPYYGKVWYDDKSIANISSLDNLVKKYIFNYEPHQYDAFPVQTNRGINILIVNKQGPYVLNPT